MKTHTKTWESLSGENISQSGIQLKSNSSAFDVTQILKIKRFLLFVLLAVLFTSLGFSQVNPNYHYVRGHYRSNGTYVQGYYRTNPNSTIRDNYSTYPNVNPHTGKVGTVKLKSNSPVYSVPRTSTQTYSLPKVNSPKYSSPRKIVPTYSAPRTTVPTYSAPNNSSGSYSAPRRNTPTYSVLKVNVTAYSTPKKSAPIYSAPKTSSYSSPYLKYK